MNKVIETLKKHILTDGYHHIMDFNKSHDSYLVDKVSGKSYLDCFGQFGSLALGYNHPALIENKEKLTNAALCKIVNSDLYSEEYAEFVETLFDKTLPKEFKYGFFIEGGANAVDNALKITFDWKQKKSNINQDNHDYPLDVIHFKEAFHGRTGYSLSMTNTGLIKTQHFPLFSWTRVINPKTTAENVEELEIKALKDVQRACHYKKVAAIIIEPIQSEGGNNMFRPSFLAALREIANQEECLLIFDEVQTGLGASGKWWCFEHYVTPDILVFGKKIQVCGVASTTRVDEVKDNCFHQSGRINSTWGGNLVDMVRAKIIIDTIEKDNLLNNVKETGNYFLEKLKELEHERKIKNARGIGLLLAFDMETEKDRDILLFSLREDMMILPCGEKSIRFRPALTFGKDDANEAIRILRKCL